MDKTTFRAFIGSFHDLKARVIVHGNFDSLEEIIAEFFALSPTSEDIGIALAWVVRLDFSDFANELTDLCCCLEYIRRGQEF